MDSHYLIIACGFVGFAIALSLWQNTGTRQRAFDIRTWLTSGLYRGDFRALSVAARGHVFDLDPDQLKRLSARGFVRQNLFGANNVTLKGRAALVLRAAIGSNNFVSG